MKFIAWLKETWQNFITWVYELLQIIFGFLENLFLSTFQFFYNAIVDLIVSIPVPEFLSNGLGSIFNSLHPDIVYFLSMSGIDVGFSIYAAGVSFNLLRKLFTLGQW